MRQSRSDLGPIGIANRHVAQDQVAVSGERLRVGCERKVRAERERPLSQNGRRGVVHHDEYARCMSLMHPRRDVADVEPRIAGALQPEELGSVELFALGVAGRRGRPDGHPDLGEVALCERPRSVVAVSG